MMLRKGTSTGRPMDKVSTLRITLVEPYSKSHRSNSSSRPIWLIVCTNRMIARFLVSAEKYKKVVFFFNKVSTFRSRVEGHILNKKAGVKMQSDRANEDRLPSQANQPAFGLH